MKPPTQRDAFWNRVFEQAAADENVMIVSADMAAPALDQFRRKLPAQFVNVGIAEQNTILVAAGLALEGKKVYAYAIAPFITYRCFEQIKIYLAGMNLPVTVVGVGAGLSYDDSGPTHHTIEDISVMRILPHLRVYTMTDSVMAAAFAGLSREMKHPHYVRLDRQRLPALYREDADYSSGLAVLREGKGIALVATGNMVHRALEAAEDLEKKGISARVIDAFALPLDPGALRRALAGCPRAVTLEEHTLPGGFGSAVLEALAEGGKGFPVLRIGLDMSRGYCYKYGGRSNLQSLYGLDRKKIVSTVLDYAAAG